MKKLIAGLAASAALLFGSAALASTCPANPYTLTNGSTADATQVMADFNNLLNCLNLNVAPLASPTFTGTVTIPTLTVTGAGSISGNLSVSGASTLGGAVTANNGIVAVGGVAAGPALDALTPNNFTTGGVRVRGNATTGFAFIQFTDSTAANEWGYLRVGTGAGDTGPAYWVGGGFNFISSVSISNGLTLSGGGLTLPAASVINADLDTVDTTPGTCGSSNTTCVVTFNAQGRASNTTSATIQPDTCVINTTSGYCKNPNGYVHQWYHYDSGGNFWSGGPQTITFPFSPAHGCYAYSAITDNQGGVASPRYGLQITSSPGGASVTVQAVGYQSSGANNIEGFYVSADCY